MVWRLACFFYVNLVQVSLDEVCHIWRVLEATPTRRARLLPHLDSLEAELIAARSAIVTSIG